MKRIAVYSILIPASLALLAIPAAAQNGNPFGASVQGAWNVQFTITTAPPFIPAGTQFPALLVFHGDGTMAGSDNDPVDGAAHGVWGRAGSGEYIFTFYSFEFDPAKGSVGSAKVRGRLTVDPTAATFTGRWQLDFINPDGTLGFIITGTYVGKRMALEAPPQ
jgi:hypothetical protein